MTTVDAQTTAAFPSVQWFELLASRMAGQRDHFVKLGDCDCVGQLTIWDGPGGDPWRCQFRFEQYDVVDIREITEDDEESSDFILETDLETWQEMVASIIEGEGTPGLGYTLNRLAMPGTPIRLWSHDPLQRDTFYRFNQTIQHFINNCATFTTEWITD
jgi:hypothetical protein